MKKIYGILFSCFLLIINSCKPSIENFNIDGQLTASIKKVVSKGQASDKFSICDLIPNKEIWDSIIVVPPYNGRESLDSIKLINAGAIPRDAFTLDEGKSTLLFVKNQEVFGYALVSRMPIDFTRYDIAVYAIRRSYCGSIYLIKQSDRYKVSYKNRVK